MPISDHKKISVVFMPDYLIPTLKNAGLGFSELNQLMSNKDLYDNNEVVRKVAKMVSKNDLQDLVGINKLLSSYFFGEKYLGSSPVNNFINTLKYETNNYADDENGYKDLINFYYDSTIIMSGDSDIKTFEFNTQSNTLFIVLHKGFTNFISLNNLEFVSKFNNLMFKHLLVNFGESTVYENTDLFKTFLKQI